MLTPVLLALLHISQKFLLYSSYLEVKWLMHYICAALLIILREKAIWILNIPKGGDQYQSLNIYIVLSIYF